MTDIRQHLIDSLKRLCENTPGGFAAVAEAIQADDQSLYQIVKGVKLPSGNPKGVGPTLQKKLDAAYPGWADMPSRALAAEPGAGYGWPFSTVDRGSITRLAKPALNTLERIVNAFLGQPVAPTFSADGWREVAISVAYYLDDPVRKEIIEDFIARVDRRASQPVTPAPQSVSTDPTPSR